VLGKAAGRRRSVRAESATALGSAGVRNHPEWQLELASEADPLRVASNGAAGHPGVIWWTARPRRHDLEGGAPAQWAPALALGAFYSFASETNAEVRAEEVDAEAAQAGEVAELVNARPGTPAGHQQEAASSPGGTERLPRR
jgi:hypothetical protein